MSRRTSALLIWLLTDVLLFLGSYVLAYFVRVGFVFSTAFPIAPYLTIALCIAPIWLATLLCTRTFTLLRRQRTLRVASYVLYAAVLSTSLFALTYYFVYGLFFSRLLLVYAFAFSFAIPLGWHILWEEIMRSWLRQNPPVYPTLIIGANREAAALIRLLQKTKCPLKPVAILDGRGSKEKAIEGVPVEGKLHKLEETMDRHQVTHLIQCSDLEQTINLLSACRSRGMTYLLLPSVLGIGEDNKRIESLEGEPVTTVRPPESTLGWFFN